MLSAKDAVALKDCPLSSVASVGFFCVLKLVYSPSTGDRGAAQRSSMEVWPEDTRSTF